MNIEISRKKEKKKIVSRLGVIYVPHFMFCAFNSRNCPQSTSFQFACIFIVLLFFFSGFCEGVHVLGGMLDQAAVVHLSPSYVLYLPAAAVGCVRTCGWERRGDVPRSGGV